MKKSFVKVLFFLLGFSAFSQINTIRLGINVSKDEVSGFYKGFEYEYFQEIAKYTGWNYEYFSDSEVDYNKAIQEGKLDIAIDYSAINKKISSYDFMTSLRFKNQKLKEQFNKAQQMLTKHDPYFTFGLKEKYFVSGNTYADYESRIIEWVSSHDCISVGYKRTWFPFCEEKNNFVSGFLSYYFSEILWKLNLENINVKYIPYDTFEDATEALKNKEIDILFPIYGNYNISEQAGLNKTSDIVNLTLALVYLDPAEGGKKPEIYCRDDFHIYENYIKEYLPDCKSNVFNFKFPKDYKKILREKNAAILVGSSSVNFLLSDFKANSLHRIQLADSCPVAFAVRREDTELLNILDYAISKIESNFSINILNEILYRNKIQSLGEIIKSNLLEVFSILFILILLCICGFVKYIETIQNHKLKLEQSKKELNEALKAAETANKAKSTFLNNMSHDIRTPMNAIVGFTELMKKNLNNPEVLESYIKKIEASSDYLLSLINNVLDMARIESGKTLIDESFYDMQSESEYYYAVFEKDIKTKKLTFINKLNVRHRYIYADRLKLRQIWLNLTSNAIKYTPENGHISVITEEKPSEIEGFATYVISIIDDGIGISKDFLPYIFDSFSREHNSTESKVMGSGLGMPIVKRIVELMGGTIVVESELGKGTKISVTLTHRIAEPRKEIDIEKKIDEIAAVNFADKNVLLVEDNDLNAEIASTILSGMGFNVDYAQDGIECCDKVRKSEDGFYDLILMDIQMPNMDGYEATRNIRAMENKSKAKIPIIAMTANAFDTDRNAAFEAGMNSYVAKPVNVPDLVETIRHQLGM